MKKTLILAVVLACSGAVAQEKQVWACQMEESTMLRWEGNGWESYGLTPQNLLLTLNANNTGSVDQADVRPAYSIDCTAAGADRISCLDITKFGHLLFDPNTGRLGISQLVGATMTGGKRDSVQAKIFNCTKF